MRKRIGRLLLLYFTVAMLLSVTLNAQPNVLTIFDYQDECILNELNLGLDCYDIAPNCAPNAHVCTHPVFRYIMSRDCMRTCGLCPDTTPDPEEIYYLEQPINLRIAPDGLIEWDSDPRTEISQIYINGMLGYGPPVSPSDRKWEIPKAMRDAPAYRALLSSTFGISRLTQDMDGPVSIQVRDRSSDGAYSKLSEPIIWPESIEDIPDPGLGCYDIASNCAANVANCRRSGFEAIMSVHCRATCDLC